MKTILSTKKLTDSTRNKLVDINFKVIEKKFIKTKKIDFQAKTINEFIIFTSKKAVKSILKNRLANQIKENKVFCVGQKTKQFLEENGFIVEENATYANDLAQIIKEKYSHNSFTFFSGSLRKDVLPNQLTQNNIKWNEVVVYETILNPKKIKGETDGILFFSPSAIASYLTKNKLENQICFCIGTTTAKALENKTKNIQIAAQPTVESVVEEILKYYTQ